MSADNGEDVKLSPKDLEKVKKANELVSQATTLLEDVPEDVREEYGDLDDCISKLEEVEGLLSGVADPDDGEGADPAE